MNTYHRGKHLFCHRFSILGVSSWGDCEKFPDVYARVTTAEDWIMEQAPGVQHSDCGIKQEKTVKVKVPESSHVKNEDLLLDLMTNNDKEPSKKLLVKKRDKQ